MSQRSQVEASDDRSDTSEKTLRVLELSVTLGAVHALSHPMGAIREPILHHGTLNAVLMPAVLRFNRAAIGPKWDVLARRLGGAPDEVIAALNSEIDIPGGLRDMGVTDAMMEAVSHSALEDHCHLTNPRLASQEDYLGMLRDAA